MSLGVLTLGFKFSISSAFWFVQPRCLSADGRAWALQRAALKFRLQSRTDLGKKSYFQSIGGNLLRWLILLRKTFCT